MLTQITQWLITTWQAVWDFMLGGGYLTMLPILFIVLRKLVSVMKQFTD